MKVLLVITLLLAPFFASASLTDCQNLYVGRVWINKGHGLYAVVYLNKREDSSGSFWSLFTGWTPEEKKAVLSTLMAAKVSGHRVNVETENTDSCGLQTAGTVTKSIHLTTAP